MGCGCGKRSASATASVLRSARDAEQSLSPGLSPAAPVLLGTEQEETLMRVRVLKNIKNLRTGQAAWVQGAEVAARIEDGTLHDITSTTQKARMWKVNAFIYSDYTKALKAAKRLGATPVEVA